MLVESFAGLHGKERHKEIHCCEPHAHNHHNYDHDIHDDNVQHSLPEYDKLTSHIGSRISKNYLCHGNQLSSTTDQLSLKLQVFFKKPGPTSPSVYMELLKGCIDIRSISHAKEIYAHIIHENVSLEGLLGDYLVVTLATCGAIDDALSVRSMLKRGTVYSWTAIISAYVKRGYAHEAFKIYKLMQADGIEPNQATFVSLFQACSSVQDLEQGKTLHVEASKRSLLSNQIVGNCLVHMYIKCGDMRKAEEAFTGLMFRDVVSWNTMLSAYVDQGEPKRALQLFRQMQEDGHALDHLTIVSTIQACGSLVENEKENGWKIQIMSLEMGLALHAKARNRSLGGHVTIASTLVVLYGKCGLMGLAEEVFWASFQHDTILWNSMLGAYLEHGQGEKALSLCILMQRENIIFDEVTFIHSLQACGELGTLETCSYIHFVLVSIGCESVHMLAASLIQAYRGCASMLDVDIFFHSLAIPDYVTWTTSIAGHAGDGNFASSMQLFEDVQLVGVDPDEVIFTAVLSACSHCGLVFEGLQYFHSLKAYFGKDPNLKHYAIVLDLLGRAGNFKSLLSTLEQMPIQVDLSIWLSLLGACRMHFQVELAKKVFEHVIALQPDFAFAYILMANIYIDVGLKGHAADVEIARRKQGGSIKHTHELIDDDEIYMF